MDFDLAGTTVLIKLTGIDPSIGKAFGAFPIVVEYFDARGVWFRDGDRSNEFAAGEFHARKMPLGPKPYVFVPLSRIEWMMAPE
jgi:hypothetical protein